VIRDNHAQQPSTPLAAACATDSSQTATVCPPWRTVPRSRLIPLFEAGSNTQRRERPGPSGDLVPDGGQPRAAHRRSTDSPPVGRHLLSRAAVTAVTSRGGASPQGAATPCGLKADPAHNRTPFAGRAQLALQTHLPSSPALRPTTNVERTPTTPGSRTASSEHAPSPALAPGLSPTPSRLTRSALSARPVEPAHQEQVARPVAQGDRSDAARIADVCSAPATPAAGVSAAQGVATAPHPTQTSAAPLATYLQIGVRRGGAPHQPARRSRPASASLSSQPGRMGMGFPAWLSSNKPAGLDPAGVTTQGETH
jgi:hypothetical protein